MKKSVTIVGTIDEEKGEIKLSKHGLDVLHLIMTITELTKMLFNDLDEEDHEAMKKLLNDIAENPEYELKKQFKAIRLSRLMRALKDLEALVEDEDDERLN